MVLAFVAATAKVSQLMIRKQKCNSFFFWEGEKVNTY